MIKEYRIKNSDGDFLQVQNYILQLVAEKKLTHTAFVLYSFYRSIAGFDEIRMGYRFIEANTGVSKGSISKCNKLLVKEGLIRITNRGPNNPFLIDITPGSNLPRRKFKEPERAEYTPPEENFSKSSSSDEHVSDMNTQSLQDERINIDNKNNTTIGVDVDKIEDYNNLTTKIIKTWKKHHNSKFYTKQDLDQVYKIIEPKEAIKYVDTMWSLDEVDKWTRKSDHTISVFVHLYLTGKLQAYYQNTMASRRMAWDLK